MDHSMLMIHFIGILNSLGKYGKTDPEYIEKRGYESAIAHALALKLNDGDLKKGNTCVEYPVEEWRQLVVDGKCIVGYWNWVFVSVMANRVETVTGKRPDFHQLTAAEPLVYEDDVSHHQKLAPSVARFILKGVIDWANKNKPIKKDHPLTKDDICYVSLSREEMKGWPGKATYDPWLRCRKKTFDGVELRETYSGPQQITGDALGEFNRAFSRRIVWKITGNTAALFKHGGEKDNGN